MDAPLVKTVKQCSACRTTKKMEYFMKNNTELKTCLHCRDYQKTHKPVVNKLKSRMACRKYYLKKKKLNASILPLIS
jgi:Zn ribbon nucleic-acid-binding protein